MSNEVIVAHLDVENNVIITGEVEVVDSRLTELVRNELKNGCSSYGEIFKKEEPWKITWFLVTDELMEVRFNGILICVFSVKTI